MQRTELNRIIDQLNRLHESNWTGVDISLLLNEIDDEIANTELELFNNTIHQIARHILTDDILLINRLNGIDHKLSEEENWIPKEKLKSIKWSDTKNAFIKSKDDLVNALQSLTDADLDGPILKDHSTVYENLHGHIQHSYYHFGQIIIMKKAIDNLNKK